MAVAVTVIVSPEMTQDKLKVGKRLSEFEYVSVGVVATQS